MGLDGTAASKPDCVPHVLDTVTDARVGILITEALMSLFSREKKWRLRELTPLNHRHAGDKLTGSGAFAISALWLMFSLECDKAVRRN